MKTAPQIQNSITTQNLAPTGTATAGSAVEIFPANASSLAVEVTTPSSYTGALSAQVTVDGTTWTTLTGSVFNPINGGAATATIASGSTGKWSVALGPWSGFRITALAAVTGTAVVSLNQGNGSAAAGSGGGVSSNVNISQVNGGAVSGPPAGGFADQTTQAAVLAALGSPRWPALSSVIQFTDAAGNAPTLKNLANGGLILSNEFDNSAAANRFQLLYLDLLVRGASAFSSGGTVDVWILTALNGSSYEDGSESITPGRSPDLQFALRAVNTAQRIEMPIIAVPPCKFKLLVRNSGGQAFTNTDGQNVLTGYTN